MHNYDGREPVPCHRCYLLPYVPAACCLMPHAPHLLPPVRLAAGALDLPGRGVMMIDVSAVRWAVSFLAVPSCAE